MANLRDIYRYFSGWTGGKPNDLPFRGVDYGGESSFLRQTGAELGLGAENERDQVHWSIKPDSFLGNLNQQYGGAAQFDPNVRNNDSGSDKGWLNIDYGKLPTTRFGTVDKSVPVSQGVKVIDPRYVYDDPTYGRITHAGNVRTGNEWMGQALMAAAMMGVGGLGMPSLASGAIKGVQGAFNRNPGALLSALAGFAGAPSWATSMGRAALSQLGRRKP